MSHDAQKTVLALLSALRDPFPVVALLQAAQVLGVEEGAVRMALTRLKTKKLVENPKRGVWALSKVSMPTYVHTGAWRDLQSRVMGWDGGSWVMVVQGPEGRESAATRSRLRALRLLGFKLWHGRIWMRPNNLVTQVEGLRRNLMELGLRQEDLVMLVSRLDEHQASELDRLWDTKALEARYRECLGMMEEARQKPESLGVERLSKHFYEVGDEVIRTLAFDPLLPSSMVDVSLRARCVEEMKAFDRQGRNLWRQLLKDLL